MRRLLRRYGRPGPDEVFVLALTAGLLLLLGGIVGTLLLAD